jgi:hypothetical protein
MPGIGGIDSYVKTLLHANSYDGDTTNTVFDPYRQWLTAGGAACDTDQYKFGDADYQSSVLFDGDAYLYIASASSDFYPATGDFTWDFWVRFSSVAATQYFLGLGGTAANAQYYWFDQANLRLYFKATAGSVDLAEYYCSWNPVVDTWYHLAYVRNGSTFYIFIDGQSQALTEVTAISTNDLTPGLASIQYIGRKGSNASDYVTGWMDEMRFSKGIARWTSNFTAPTEQYDLGYANTLGGIAIKELCARAPLSWWKLPIVYQENAALTYSMLDILSRTTDGTISGVVKRNGIPYSGARVFLAHKLSGMIIDSRLTGSDGSYSFGTSGYVQVALDTTDLSDYFVFAHDPEDIANAKIWDRITAV